MEEEKDGATDLLEDDSASDSSVMLSVWIVPYPLILLANEQTASNEWIQVALHCGAARHHQTHAATM